STPPLFFLYHDYEDICELNRRSGFDLVCVRTISTAPTKNRGPCGLRNRAIEQRSTSPSRNMPKYAFLDFLRGIQPVREHNGWRIFRFRQAYHAAEGWIDLYVGY